LIPAPAFLLSSAAPFVFRRLARRLTQKFLQRLPIINLPTLRKVFRLTLGKPGMVVARALVDPALADELRDSCMSVALALGGWAKPAKSKNAKSKAAGAS